MNDGIVVKEINITSMEDANKIVREMTPHSIPLIIEPHLLKDTPVLPEMEDMFTKLKELLNQ